MSQGLTPSQTIGPFYWGTLVNTCRCDLAPLGVAGAREAVGVNQGLQVAVGLLERRDVYSESRREVEQLEMVLGQTGTRARC